MLAPVSRRVTVKRWFVLFRFRIVARFHFQALCFVWISKNLLCFAMFTCLVSESFNIYHFMFIVLRCLEFAYFDQWLGQLLVSKCLSWFIEFTRSLWL